MLLPNEIKIGNLYAWDMTESETLLPPYGCNLFTILNVNEININKESSEKKLTGQLHAKLTMFSVDGRVTFLCSSARLITARNAFERIDAIEQAIKDSAYVVDNRSVNLEIIYLKMFKTAFLRYGMANAMEDSIFNANNNDDYLPYINKAKNDDDNIGTNSCGMAQIDDTVLDQIREMVIIERKGKISPFPSDLNSHDNK